MTNDIPLAVIRKADDCPNPHALILWLDGRPYLEVSDKSLKVFKKKLEAWGDRNLETLARSNYRLYVKEKTEITEL
jgi:hypothetical protein